MELHQFSTKKLKAAKRNLENAKAKRKGGLLVAEKKALANLNRELKAREEMNIYKGQYFVAGKNKEKAEALAERVSNSEEKVALLRPSQKSTLATARRAVSRDRKPLRVTPKTPRLRR